MKPPVVAPSTTPPVVAPRISTAAPSRGSSSLPEDILSEQARRIVLFSGVAAFMWSFGLAMDAWILPTFVGIRRTDAAVTLDLVGAAITLAVFLFVRFVHLHSHTKCLAGIWVMLINAALITALDLVNIGMVEAGLGRPSWIAILILTAAMIMPSTPRRTLIASLVAAAMAPVAMMIASFAGRDVPPASALLVIYLPNFIWAAVATLPSAIFQRMGRQLKQARELGSYELVEQLGAGGMGTVWRARHRFLARDAAVKLVKAASLGSSDSTAESQLRRFEREAQATALLRSPHSIRLFDFGTADDGSFYYVMELLEGRDLESLVHDFGPLPPERAVYLLRQVCHSLAEAHARGMVHRDIKPANIFLCRMGLEFDFIKVLDFGLVKTQKADPAAAETEAMVTAQQLIGTPAYMAPEIILGKDNVDRRADVYAIGCVAFFLLTGTRVFEAATQMQALIDHVHTEPVPPSVRLGQPLPRALDQFVLACLRKKPEERPHDAADLLDRIGTVHLAGAWSAAHARAWWQERLPEFSAPLGPVDEINRASPGIYQ